MVFRTLMTEAEANAQAEALLQGVLAQVPAGANPISVGRALFHSLLYPVVPTQFKTQLYVLSGLIAALTLILTLCLLVKWIKGDLWFFMVQQERGSLIIPHYTSNWVLFNIIGTGLQQAFIWKTIDYTDGELSSSFMAWKMLTWLPSWIGFWTTSWSLAVSHVLFMESQGYSGGFFTSHVWLNIYGLAIPIVLIGAVIPVGDLAAKHFGQGLESFQALDAGLAAAEAAWTGTVTPEQEQGVVALGGDFFHHFDIFISFFKAGFALYCATGILITLTFLVAAVVHVRSLKSTLNELGHHNGLPTKQEVSIRGQYKSLVFITGAFSFITLFAEVLNVFIAADASNVIHDVVSNEGASLMPLYIFAVCGIPFGLFLLAKALTSKSIVTDEVATRHDHNQLDSNSGSGNGLAAGTELMEQKMWSGSPMSDGSAISMSTTGSPVHYNSPHVTSPTPTYTTYYTSRTPEIQ